MSKLIKRSVSDDNFEHCAKGLLPFAVEAIRGMKPGQRVSHDLLNCIQIAAEVAQAFAEREYGKPRFRVQARSEAHEPV